MKFGRKLSRRYPWRRWFAAKKFTLRRGVDYDSVVSICQQIRNRAHVEGVGVEIETDAAENVIIVKVKESPRCQS